MVSGVKVYSYANAIEQFNGLRRELFDTAWRMTSDHSMHDVLRLTENQINMKHK